MFTEYETAVERNGLMAEFAYIDSSADFFWVPPGYASALSYDSVRTIVTQNAAAIRSISLTWDSLRIIPLTASVAAYTGILRWRSEGFSGLKTESKLLETGIVVKRNDGWKLLGGQTMNLESEKAIIEAK
jgi:hypothetical protein